MEIVVLVEPLEGGRYRARAGGPVDLVAEGTTPDEATQRLRALVETMIASGRQLVTISVTNGQTANIPAAALPADNVYQTDWIFRELQEAIAEGRRQDEAQ